jgi:hypothetical protein
MRLPEIRTFVPLFNSAHLWSRDEVLARPCPIPKEPGIYAWYFKSIPPGVPTKDCLEDGQFTLLYVGIAPKALPAKGARPSRQRLSHRIRYHYRGIAEGSTLRLTLGCLLAKELGITLRRVGSGKRLTFSEGENILSQWMADNAFVTWMVHPEPWNLEAVIIGKVSLPLNLHMNKGHPFHGVLTKIRREAKEKARGLPVV